MSPSWLPVTLAVIQSPHCSSSLIMKTCDTLFSAAAIGEATQQTTIHNSLSSISQRHPSEFTAVARTHKERLTAGKEIAFERFLTDIALVGSLS